MYKVEILGPAWDDIQSIADMHLSLVGPQSAKKFAKGILDTIETLAVFPYGYPKVPDDELSQNGYRMVLYKKYLIAYRVVDNIVYVYHVADGRTNYPQIIKGYI